MPALFKFSKLVSDQMFGLEVSYFSTEMKKSVQYGFQNVFFFLKVFISPRFGSWKWFFFAVDSKNLWSSCEVNHWVGFFVLVFFWAIYWKFNIFWTEQGYTVLNWNNRIKWTKTEFSIFFFTLAYTRPKKDEDENCSEFYQRFYGAICFANFQTKVTRLKRVNSFGSK